MRLYTNGHDKNISGAEIAANSLDISRGYPVAITNGYATKATAGDTIVGLSVQERTYDSDNQTVAKEKLNYLGLDDNMEIAASVSGGTISQANVGTLYDIDANGDIDAATAGTGDTLALVKVFGTTEGAFVRAK